MARERLARPNVVQKDAMSGRGLQFSERVRVWHQLYRAHRLQTDRTAAVYAERYRQLCSLLATYVRKPLGAVWSSPGRMDTRKGGW